MSALEKMIARTRLEYDPKVADELDRMHRDRRKMREAIALLLRHYDLNDCDDRQPDGALEIPIGDLRKLRDSLAVEST